MNEKQPFNYTKLYRRIVLIIYDVISIVAASYVALLMRYDFVIREIPEEFLLTVSQFLPLNIVLTIVIFYFFKMYSSLWADAV